MPPRSPLLILAANPQSRSSRLCLRTPPAKKRSPYKWKRAKPRMTRPFVMSLCITGMGARSCYLPVRLQCSRRERWDEAFVWTVRPNPKVFGWFERAAIPAAIPFLRARAKLGFSYFSDANNGEIVLYDCAQFAGVTADGSIPSSIGRRGLPWAKPLLSPVAVTSNPSAPGWE